MSAYPGGKMIALNLSTGALLWESARWSQPRGATELERVADVVSVPVVEDRRLRNGVPGSDRVLRDHARHAAWARNASGTSDLAVDDRYFFYVDEASNLYAIDRDSGASIWKQDCSRIAASVHRPVVGNYVVVGDLRVTCTSIARTAVSRRGSSTDGGPITAAAVPVGPENLVVQTRKGGPLAITVR